MQSTFRDVTYVVDPFGPQLGDDAAAARQQAERVIGAMRLAMATERAGQRIGTVGADADCGLGAVSQRVEAGLHPPRHLW